MSRLSVEKIFEQFLQNAREKFNDNYDYSEVVYTRGDVKVPITCKLHEERFLQTPANHLYGFAGCSVCAKLKTRKALGHTKDDFVKACHKIHSNKYDYSKVIYENWESMITIGCPYHGDFIQQANSHKQGTGCPTCSRYKTSRLGGMSNIKGLDDELVHLYVVTFKSDKYEFVKVGLTSRTVAKRFEKLAYQVYDQTVVLDITLPAKDAVALEADCLKTFYKNRYHIRDKVDTFKGCTELFKIDITDDLVSYINSKLSSSHERTCVET